MKIIETLKKSQTPLSVKVLLDEFTNISSKAFDFEFDGESKFYPWSLPNKIDKNFKLGVLYGNSGCLGKGTKVLMYDNTFKNVEDVKIGDKLMGPDSTPRNVLKLFSGVEQMYWVKQNKGLDYRVNGSHILSLKNRQAKMLRKTVNGKRVFLKHISANKNKINNISVNEFITKTKSYKTNNKGYKSKTISFEKNGLSIHPYFLGIWLGDGDSDRLAITNIDEEIITFIKEYSLKEKMLLSERYNKKGTGNYLLHNGRIGKSKSNLLLNSFKKNNLFNNKHIPLKYLSSSEEDRLELLAGIIDTDGSYCKKRNSFAIVQKNNRLSENITQLARSLGFYTSNNKNVRKIKSINFEGLYNRILISGDLDRIPTKIKRKKAKKTTRNSDWLVTGINIEKDIIDNYYGFQLDGDNLFLLEDYTVTHNSGKSTLLNEFGTEYIPEWDKTKAIVSHFKDPEEAINKLSAVGLNTIPSWNQPYHTLSTGEKFRADMSRKLFNGSVIDEYTSVIDRNVAKATSMALKRYLKTHDLKNIVLSTCHEDVIEYLEPDWVVDTNTGNVYDGFFLTENQSILKSISQTVQYGTCLKNIII